LGEKYKNLQVHPSFHFTAIKLLAGTDIFSVQRIRSAQEKSAYIYRSSHKAETNPVV